MVSRGQSQPTVDDGSDATAARIGTREIGLGCHRNLHTPADAGRRRPIPQDPVWPASKRARKPSAVHSRSSSPNLWHGSSTDSAIPRCLVHFMTPSSWELPGLSFDRKKRRRIRACSGACMSGPTRRGTGLARRLVEAVIAHARGRVELIQLSVVVGNKPARRLYASLGFVEYGIEKKSLKYRGRYYDEILMAKDLSPASNRRRDPLGTRRRCRSLGTGGKSAASFLDQTLRPILRLFRKIAVIGIDPLLSRRAGRERPGFLREKTGLSCFPLALSGGGHGPPNSVRLEVLRRTEEPRSGGTCQRRLRLTGGTRFSRR